MRAHDAMPQHEAVSQPAGAVDEDSGYSADGACADSVEWLLAEMLRGSTAAEEGLPQRLQREGFWEALGSEARALRSVSSAEREGLMKAMWRHVRKFSVGRCNMLLSESRKAAAQAAADGDDVTVALGYTGAGKTTLMHVLRGSAFEVDECGRLHPKCAGTASDGLRVGDNDGRSETRFVRLVKDVEGRLLADSPGFQDTDGPEVEVANVLGVAEFLQACRSVRLVVVVNAEGFGNKGQGLRLLAGMLGSLLRDPAAAMRSTTFLYTKEQDTTHQGMNKKVCDVYKVAVQEDDKTIQCILGELKKQAVNPRLYVVDSDEDFEEEEGLEDAADGKAVLLRPCGGDRYDLVYGEHGKEHHTTVSLPHIGNAGNKLKLDQKLRGELIAAVEAAGAPPLFLGACVSVRPLDPACAGRVLRAVQARPAVQAPCNVFGREAGLREETTLAVREQALVDVKSIQSSVAYCAGLAGGGGACTGAQQEGVQGAPAEEGGAQQEAAAVWRIVGWRLERLAATYELLQDDHVGRALQEAQGVVRNNLQQRLDDAVKHVARVAGPEARLTEDDTQQVQRAIDGIAAAREVEKLVPDVSWGVLEEKVQWHLREYARVADAALKENKPQQAGVALQQLQLLAEQTRMAVPSDGCSAADVRDAAVRCGQQHFDGLCAAVQQRIKEGALHSTEALQGTATALSDMCVHHKHLHAVLHLGDLDSTAYTPAVEALREGLAGLTAACARDADELARLQVRDDARQQQLVAQLRDRLAVLAEAEAVCSQHIDVPVLHAFVRGAQGACVAAVDTLCGRAERAVKGVGVERGAGTGGDPNTDAGTSGALQDGAVQTHAHAQEMQGDDAELCIDIVEKVRQAHCGVTAESLGRYTEMQARVNAAAAVAVAEVRRLVDIVVARTADGAGVGAVQRDQAAVLVQYIKQLQRQPALSRYSQEGQGLVAATQQACRQRVGRELQRLGQEALPLCGSADELLAYCMRMSGVMAVVPLGEVLPDMHGMLAAAEAAHTRCVQQRLACLEAVLGVPPTVTALQAEPLPAQGEEGAVCADDPGLHRFTTTLLQRKQAAARGGAAAPPCTLADLLAALARVGEVRRVVHGAAEQAAQRVEAGLRDYIHGGATVQDTYAAAVCASLEKSVQAIAGVCDDLELADAKAGGGEARAQLPDHVAALCQGLACLAEVEAAASQGVYQGSDTVCMWQARLHTQVVQVLDQWLAVGDAHVADVKAVVQSLLPLDAHTDGAVVALKKDCWDKFLKLFDLNDPVLEEAVKSVDAECVRERLDFLQKSKQGTQTYKRLQRRWKERVQQLINFRLPAFGSTNFEECAKRLRGIHEHATEVLARFAGDEESQHLGETMLQDLEKCKEAAAGPQLADRLKKSLLQPLEDAVRYRRFNDAKELLQQVDQAEDTLHNLLSDSLRADIENVRNLHSKELDALQEDYRNWGVADPNSPALLNLARVLRECDECRDVTQAIRSEVDNKVRLYVQKQREAVEGHDVSLAHLEEFLPQESSARREIVALKEQTVAKVKDDRNTCLMHIDIGEYASAVEMYKKQPNDLEMRDMMRKVVTGLVNQCNDAVEANDMEKAVHHLDQLDKLYDHLPDLGASTAHLKERVSSVVRRGLSSVLQSLRAETTPYAEDVKVAVAARRNMEVSNLVGEEGMQHIQDIVQHLVGKERQLHKALQDGAADEAARLLKEADDCQDLSTHFHSGEGAALSPPKDRRRKVEAAVAERVLPELRVGTCDNKKERDELIITLQERLRFAAQALHEGLPNSDLLQGGEGRVQKFVQDVGVAARTARKSITVSCTEQVVPYGLHLEMLSALKEVECAHEEAARCFNREKTSLLERVQAAVSTVVWGSKADNDVTDRTVVAALLELQLLADIPACQKEAQNQRDVLIGKYREERSDVPSPLADLYVRLKTDDTGYGGKVIAARKDAFVSEEITAFNTKVGEHGIEYVLSKLGLPQSRRTELLGMYDANYTTEYGKKVDRLLGARLKDARAFERVVSECAKAVTDFQPPAGLLDRAVAYIAPSEETTCFKALAGVFAVWSVHCCEGGSTGRVQKKPHPTQVLAVFEAVMAVRRGEGLLTRILTGEGKSVVLGVLATTLALQGFDVNCVCYSQYLSRRDYNNSQSLFEVFKVAKSVHYGTVDELCERVLSERTGDFRAQVEQALTDTRALRRTEVPQKRSLLLVDEVDVVFSKVFLGAAFTPSVQVRNEAFVELTDYVWKHCRAAAPGAAPAVVAQRRVPHGPHIPHVVPRAAPQGLGFESVKGVDAYKQCCAAFAEWAPLVEEAAKDLVHAAGSYQEDTDWKVEGGKVVYRHFDGYTSHIVRGYHTLFHYYQAHEQGDVTREAVEAEARLLVRCGFFSYAQLGKQPLFEQVLGVSGTLPRDGSAEQKMLMDEYNIKRAVQMPSMFGSSSTDRTNLVFRPEEHTVTAPTDAFMVGLAKQMQIHMKHNKQRAVLVFFETEPHLRECYNDPAFAQLRGRITCLTEHDNNEEKERKVGLASMPGNFTFCTRSFGRGTDFICTSKKVLDEGGVHTIMTFIAPESEEVQVKGRSGRQGEPGSFSFMLDEAKLETLGMDAAAVKKAKGGIGKQLYDTIMEHRDTTFRDSWIVQEKTRQSLQEVHKDSMSFLAAVQAGNTSEVRKQLLCWNKGKVITNSRTVVLVDRTYSMGPLLGCSAAALTKAADRTAKVLQEKGVPTVPGMLIALYANYNVEPDMLLESTGWRDLSACGTADLATFLRNAQPHGGWGREAVEVGLDLVLQEHQKRPVSQVILIGDAAPNTDQEVMTKRADSRYDWGASRFANPVTTTNLIQNLQMSGVKVHTYYVANHREVKQAFKNMSQQTGGTSQYLDVQDPRKSADILTEFLSTQVLRQVGGEELVQKYTEMFGTVCHVK